MVSRIHSSKGDNPRQSEVSRWQTTECRWKKGRICKDTQYKKGARTEATITMLKVDVGGTEVKGCCRVAFFVVVVTSFHKIR